MSRYGNEVPMDFEWGNGTGAVDARSPFAQVSSNAQRFPSSPSKNRSFGASQLSPSKTRMTGSQQSSPNKALPPVPAFNALFSTPRKPRPEIDDSSAGETPKSPERRDESDATPDVVNSRSTLTLFDAASAPAVGGAERRSPTKERPQADRRDSLVSRFMTKAKKIYSPGRGELIRPEPHAGGIEKRTKQKRKRDVDRRVARQRRRSSDDHTDSESERPRRHSPRKRSHHKPHPPDEKEPHWMSALFTFIGAHPSVPHILSYYAQFLFNVFLLSCCGYLIYCFWSAIQGDIDTKVHEAAAGVYAEIAECTRNYVANRCEPETRMPALQGVCEGWERCMAKDALKVGRAKVSAGTFAGIFNEFVEGISWKAMAFTSILVFGSFGMSNFAFGFFRHKAQQFHPQPGYNNYGYGGPPPPPTPQRAFSGQDGQFYAGTPWHMAPQGMGLEPMPSGSYGQIEGQGSPVRRLAYN